MRKIVIAAIAAAIMNSPTAHSGDLIGFVEKPRLFDTGDIGAGANHYRPRWSPDGRWLSFEIIDENSLRTYVAVPDADTIIECRGKTTGGSSGSLDLFADQSTGKIAVTRLAWGRQAVSNTSMFCFTDNGVLYKSNAYFADGRPSITPPKEFIPASNSTEVGAKNGTLLPELGYVTGRGQPPAVFTDNDSGDLFAIASQRGLMQLTSNGPKSKVTDTCAKFAPPDNRSLVFVRTFEGNSDLYIIRDVQHSLESTGPLLKWPESDELAPSWSPDGKRIAFYSNHAGDSPGKKVFDLYVMDVSGKAAPKLLVSGVRPDNIEEKLGPPFIGPQWMGNDVLVVARDDNHAKDPLNYVHIPTGLVEELPVGTILNDSPSICDLGDGTYLLAYTTFGKSASDRSEPDITNKIYYAKLIFSK